MTHRRINWILEHENKSDTQLLETVSGRQSWVAATVVGGRASAGLVGFIFVAGMYVKRGR
jgi:hypothetical protein